MENSQEHVVPKQQNVEKLIASGMPQAKAAELIRLKQENEELKKLLREADLDNKALQDLLAAEREGKF